MTILDSIEAILTEEGRPLHYADIAGRLPQDGVGRSRAKDIPASVRGCMLKDIKLKGEATRFVRLGNGRYGLSNGWTQEGARRMTDGRSVWGIRAGANGEAHDLFVGQRVIALAWHELGDLSRLNDRNAYKRRYTEVIPDQRERHVNANVGQLYRFVHEIAVDDVVVYPPKESDHVYLGTVTGSYAYRPERDAAYPHQRDVVWLPPIPRSTFSSDALDQLTFRMTLCTLDASGEEFRALLNEGHGASQSGGMGERGPLFTERTFDLLAQLHANPMASFYQQHKEAFKSSVEQPVQRLFRAVAARLPASITAVMETNDKIFARILKNDFGKKGAWDFYWGAFYPKGGRRTEAPQLFASINHERLEFGFYIGQYGTDDRRRFLHNSATHKEDLDRLLRVSLSQDAPVTLEPRTDQSTRADGSAWEAGGFLDAWLDHAGDADVRAAVRIPREEVVRLTLKELTRRVAGIFERLFPLVLLATEDEPMAAIRAYLNYEEEEEEEPAPPTHPVNPPYSLDACAEGTGFAVEELERWVRAIERKGQAILYGPPGTGKTYMAEHLARHLIGDGDGFTSLVQFHPAYTYEDFVQGLRPQGRPDGGLDYPLVDGRFLEFCGEASKRTGRCVLIIDEINRADLARVFGELMYLLEYRDRIIPLASGRSLSIPSNVRIIGAMNTADRSIALVDHALRRRFAFLELHPRLDILRSYHARTGFPVEGLVRTLQRVNQQIDDAHYAVGIAFFLRDDLGMQIEDIWRMEIEPYLVEYFFDQPAAVDAYRWEKIGGTIRP